MLEELSQPASIRIQRAIQDFWGFGLCTDTRMVPSVLVAAGPSLHYLGSVGS